MTKPKINKQRKNGKKPFSGKFAKLYFELKKFTQLDEFKAFEKVLQDFPFLQLNRLRQCLTLNCKREQLTKVDKLQKSNCVNCV